MTLSYFVNIGISVRTPSTLDRLADREWFGAIVSLPILLFGVFMAAAMDAHVLMKVGLIFLFCVGSNAIYLWLLFVSRTALNGLLWYFAVQAVAHLYCYWFAWP